MSDLTIQTEKPFEVRLDTERPKIPANIIRDLKLSHEDALVIKQTEERVILVPLERSMSSTSSKSRYEIARLKVGRDGRASIPLDVLDKIGGKIGGRLKFIRGRGSYQIEAECDELETLFFGAEARKKIDQKKRQANIKQIIERLTKAHNLLEDAASLAANLSESSTDKALNNQLEQAMLRIRIAKYFSK